MAQAFYLIDKNLSAQTLSSLVSSSSKTVSQPAQVVGDTTGADLPLTPDGALQPGVLYPSAASNSPVRYYLPRYVLNTTNGLYTTSLKYRGEHDDPHGPIAFLTVEVAAVPPEPSRDAVPSQLREIPHQAIARIAYQMPVQGGTPPPPPKPFAEFLGSWRNVDSNTGGMTRLDILPRDNQSVSFHGFGKCHPTDCDWGLTTAVRSGAALVGTYNFSFKTTTITVTRTGDQLKAVIFDHYAPGDGRADRNEQDVLSGGGEPVVPQQNAPTLWIEVGALAAGAPGVRTARLPINTKPDFDRLYEIMTDATFKGRLEVHCFATAGRRTWRQVVLSSVDMTQQSSALQKNVLFTDLVSKQSTSVVVPNGTGVNSRKITLAASPVSRLTKDESVKIANTPATELIQNPAGISPAALNNFHANLNVLAQVSPSFAASPAIAPHLTAAALSVAQAPQLARFNSQVLASSLTAKTVSFQPVATTVKPNVPIASATIANIALRQTVAQPLLDRAFARPLPEIIRNSDILVRVGQVPTKAAPVRAVIDGDGEPALMRIPVETVQTIDPFCFLVATNGYMFDTGGKTTDHSILIPMEVRDGSGQVVGVFYQDSAYNDRFYYQPQEFRLPRIDIPPYLPDMRILFVDLVTQEGDSGDATLSYKVHLAYRALPYIDPLLLDLAQQQAPNVQAQFNALSPVTTQLSLRVPEDETQGVLSDLPRPDVQVRFDQGIIDEIELSRTEFERIFTFFQSPSGIGIEGAVQTALLGNLNTSIPVRLSLKQNTGAVFGHTFLGPVGVATYRVRLKNRIESAVSINALYRVGLGGGAFAFPQASPGQVVPPGGELELDYKVDPATAPVADIPPAMSTSINADPVRLWPQLFVTQGYPSETFPVHLSMDAAFFGVVPPGGSDPLTGVRVEFEEGPTLTLTAVLLEADVRLSIPLLPRLLGDPQAKKYRYRVTNLLGADAHPGSTTDFVNGEGEAPLTILPAGA